MSDTSRLRVGGAVCLWRIAKSTSLQQVVDGLDMLGLKDFAPEPRTALSCLRAAIDDVFVPPEKDMRYVVRPVKNGITGFAIIAERPKDHARAGDDWGKVVAIAGLDDNGVLSLEPHNQTKYEAIKAGMAGAAEWITATAVGKSLVAIVEKLGGVCLRENGGVYWLNEWSLDLWVKVGDLFEAASARQDGEGNEVSPSRVYILKVVADEQMVRAVGDALRAEVEHEIAKIENELADSDLTPATCVRRMDKASRIEEKVRRYENAFNEPLTALVDCVQRAGQNAAMAALQASAAQVAHVSA